jgi:hypothetical protein
VETPKKQKNEDIFEKKWGKVGECGEKPLTLQPKYET